MKICIGIISYLPDELKIRQSRITKFKTLIDRCNHFFNIPIWVVAQNYKEDAAQFDLPNVKLFHYNKLGITGARKQLRELFVNSDQDYLIMLDDDCAIRGVQEEGQKFIKEIEAHPDQYCIKRPKLLKLLAISRSIYSQVEFPNINPEANEGYEDAIFCEMLKTLFPEKEFKSANRLVEFSNSATDPNSTWRNEYKTTINRTQLSTNTRNIVNDLKKDYNITLPKKTIKTIITYGTFDILHHGHIELLRRAKEMGDRLIVGLSTDEFNLAKGKKSYYDYSKRKQMLEAIKYVDEVIPENNWDQKEHDIKAHQVDAFVMGDDWVGKFDHLNSQDTQVVYLPRTPEISTSEIKHHLSQMTYVIMCGGTYNNFIDKPKHFTEVNGESVVMRTIRLLQENGISKDNIIITSNNPLFDSCGVKRLENPNNTFAQDKPWTNMTGYWVDAFYPFETPVTYLFGDVFYSENALKTILSKPTEDVLFFGSNPKKLPEDSPRPKTWEEPLAFKVVNQQHFKEAIKRIKELFNQHRIKRHPIAWELYCVLNGYYVNSQARIKNFVCINDISTDIDQPEDAAEIEVLIQKYGEDLTIK